MTDSVARPRTLVPLWASPATDARSWAEAIAGGAETVAVITMTPPTMTPPTRTPPTRTPPTRTPPTSRGGPAPDWGAVVAGVERLLAAQVPALGHLSLAYGTRPLADVVSEIAAWAALPVRGVFLDHAPAGRDHVDLVARAVGTARRCGLTIVVLNPGVPVDPGYRSLDATICTFEGPWAHYRQWSGAHTEPGDGHLVFHVAPAEWAAARALMIARRAGLLLITDRTMPYGHPPPRPTPAGVRPEPARAGGAPMPVPS